MYVRARVDFRVRPCASRCDEIGSLSDDTTHDILSKLPNRKLGFQRFRQNQDFVLKLFGFLPFDIFQEERVFGFCSLTFSTSNDTLKSTQLFSYMPHKTQTATDQSLYPTDQSLYQAFQPETVESHFFKW